MKDSLYTPLLAHSNASFFSSLRVLNVLYVGPIHLQNRICFKVGLGESIRSYMAIGPAQNDALLVSCLDFGYYTAYTSILHIISHHPGSSSPLANMAPSLA